MVFKLLRKYYYRFKVDCLTGLLFNEIKKIILNIIINIKILLNCVVYEKSESIEWVRKNKNRSFFLMANTVQLF